MPRVSQRAGEAFQLSRRSQRTSSECRQADESDLLYAVDRGSATMSAKVGVRQLGNRTEIVDRRPKRNLGPLAFQLPRPLLVDQEQAYVFIPSLNYSTPPPLHRIITKSEPGDLFADWGRRRSGRTGRCKRQSLRRCGRGCRAHPRAAAVTIRSRSLALIGSTLRQGTGAWLASVM